MRDYESDMLDVRQELNKLKIEVRNAEKWVDRAKESIETMQNKIFDLEEKWMNRNIQE